MCLLVCALLACNSETYISQLLHKLIALYLNNSDADHTYYFVQSVVVMSNRFLVVFINTW